MSRLRRQEAGGESDNHRPHTVTPVQGERESVLNSLKRSPVRTLPLPAARGCAVATAARCNGTCIEKRNGDCVIKSAGSWKVAV